MNAARQCLRMQVIFPASYNHTSGWLRDVIDVAEDALFDCQQQLLAALDEHARFQQLASSCVVCALGWRHAPGSPGGLGH